MSSKNTLKKKRLRNKKSGRRKRSLKGGMLSFGNMLNKAKTVVEEVAERGSAAATAAKSVVKEVGATDAVKEAALLGAEKARTAATTAARTLVDSNQIKEIVLKGIKNLIETNKSNFYDKLNSIPELGNVSSFFYSIVEIMMTNLPLIDLESSKQMMMKIKNHLGNAPGKFKTYLKNRLRMFSYNPKKVTQEHFKEATEINSQTFDVDDHNALVFTILSYNFEKIMAEPELIEGKDSNTVFDILKSCYEEQEIGEEKKLWHEVTNFNSHILKSVDSLKIGLDFDNIIKFEYNGSNLSIYRDLQPVKSVSKEQFSYRKHIINASDTYDEKISKFFIFKVTDNKNKAKTVIAVRGTQSFTDVSIDLDSSTKTLESVLKEGELEFTFDKLLGECSFHSGFLLSTLKIFKKIYQNYLFQFRNEEEVLICGHSMGGAEAAILGLLIKFCDQLETKNIKIITFNPGTYIVRNDAYYIMLGQLGVPTTFNNRIYRSAGDLISVCSLENIYQTATILSDSNCGQEELIQKFTTTMENKEIAKSYTDLLDVNSFRESPGLSDIITMWNSDSKNFFFNDNYKIPFLITGRASVETHSLSNFKNLILEDLHPFYERSVDETPVGETQVDKSYGPFEFISQMIALRTKVRESVREILDSVDPGSSFSSFNSFIQKIREKLSEKKIMEITKKINKRADSFFEMNLNLTLFPEIEQEKKFIKDIFKSVNKEKLSNLFPSATETMETNFDSKTQGVLKKKIDINSLMSSGKSTILTPGISTILTPGGNSTRKKRKGRILRKSTFKRNMKQKGGSPEGIVFGILQIYLGFLFCPMLTSLFLISCGPMICINLMASF